MAKKGQRINIMFQCTEEGGKKHRYYTVKNRINTKDQLTIRKFNPFLKRHAEYVEKKIK